MRKTTTLFCMSAILESAAAILKINVMLFLELCNFKIYGVSYSKNSSFWVKNQFGKDCIIFKKTARKLGTE